MRDRGAGLGEWGWGKRHSVWARRDRTTGKEEQGQRRRDRWVGIGEQNWGVTYNVLCSELLVQLKKVIFRPCWYSQLLQAWTKSVAYFLTTTAELPLLITTTPTLYKNLSNYNILKFTISVFTQLYCFFPLSGLEHLLTQHCHIH